MVQLLSIRADVAFMLELSRLYHPLLESVDDSEVASSD
jgi:hypothetical protein